MGAILPHFNPAALEGERERGRDGEMEREGERGLSLSGREELCD